MKYAVLSLGISLTLLLLSNVQADTDIQPLDFNTTNYCHSAPQTIDKNGYLQIRNALLSGLHTLHKLWRKHPASINQFGFVSDVSVKMSSGPFQEAMTGKTFCGAIIYSSLGLGKVLDEAGIPYGKEILSSLLLVPAFYHHDYVFNYNQAGLKTLLLYGTAKSSLKVLEEALDDHQVSKSDVAVVLAAGATSHWVTYALQYGKPEDFMSLAMPKIVGGAAVNMAYKDSQEHQTNPLDVVTNGFRWHLAGAVMEVICEPLTKAELWENLIPVVGDLSGAGKTISQVATYMLSISRKVQKVLGMAAVESSKQVIELYVEDRRYQESVQFFTLLLLSYSSTWASQHTDIRAFDGLRRGLVGQMALFQIKWLMKEAADLIDSSLQPFYCQEGLVSVVSDDPESTADYENCTLIPVSGAVTSQYTLVCIPPSEEVDNYDTQVQLLGLLYAMTVFLIVW